MNDKRPQPTKVRGVYERPAGSGMWVARYKIDGNDVRKTFGNRGEAVAHLEKMRTMKRAGEDIPTSAKRPLLTKAEKAGRLAGVLLDDLCDQYLAHIQNPNNPERPKDQDNPPQRVFRIKAALGDRPAASLKAYEIKDWLISLGLAAATLNRYKSTLSAIYTYSKDRELVEANPCNDVPHFRVTESFPRWMSDAEEDRLRKVIHKWIRQTPPEHKITQLLLREHLNEITVGSQTGMRKGNQYSLQWEDINFDLRLITLPDTKGGNPHTVPMTDDVYRALRDQKKIQDELKELRGEDYESSRLQLDGRVFVIEENREWFAKAKKEAKVKNLGWHQLSRHTAGSRLAAAGANQKTIQEVLGHATIAMSAKYTYLNKENVAQAMRVLNREST